MRPILETTIVASRALRDKESAEQERARVTYGDLFDNTIEEGLLGLQLCSERFPLCSNGSKQHVLLTQQRIQRNTIANVRFVFFCTHHGFSCTQTTYEFRV